MCREIRQNTQMNTTKQLTKLGLSENEAKIYISGLELGATTILNLAKKNNLPRTTIYDSVNHLISLGYFAISKKGKKKLFIASNPNVLKTIQADREQTINEIFPILLRNLKNKKDTGITYYENAEEIRNAYLLCLNLSSTKVVKSISSANVVNILGQKWIQTYVKERLKKNVPAKILITGKESEVAKWSKYDHLDLRETRFSKSISDSSTSLEIYDDRIFFASFEDEVFGFSIESNGLSKIMSELFELAWQKS